MKRYHCLLGLILMLFAISGTAQETRSLSLREAMTIALEHNFALRNNQVDITIAEVQTRGAYGIYDYHLESSVRVQAMENQRFSQFEASEQSSIALKSSISRLLSTGSMLELEAGLERETNDAVFAPLNPRYSAALSARLMQPLLRGSDTDVIETRITINGLRSELNRSRLKLQAMTLLTQVEKLYWQLVIAHDHRQVTEQSLQLFRQNLEDMRIRKEIGEAAKIAVIQAEQRVAQAESDLIDAQAMITRIEDQLKTLLVGLDWQTTILPSDDIDTGDETTESLEQLVKTALDRRPELQLLGIEKQITEVQTLAAEDQTRPRLDLFAEAQLSGKAGEFQPNFIDKHSPYPDQESLPDALQNVLEFENGRIAVGATYSFDFDNTAAEAELAVSRLKEKQVLIRREEVKHQITAEIRNALREIEIARSQISSRQVAVELAEAEYEAEKERLEEGESTAFLTLEALVNLNGANLQLVQARANLASAQVAYKRALGTTLEKSGIQMDFTNKTDTESNIPTP